MKVVVERVRDNLKDVYFETFLDLVDAVNEQLEEGCEADRAAALMHKLVVNDETITVYNTNKGFTL